MCWFHTFIYCSMITTTASANASIMSHNYRFFFVVRTFKSLSDFEFIPSSWWSQIYHRLLPVSWLVSLTSSHLRCWQCGWAERKICLYCSVLKSSPFPDHPQWRPWILTWHSRSCVILSLCLHLYPHFFPLHAWISGQFNPLGLSFVLSVCSAFAWETPTFSDSPRHYYLSLMPSEKSNNSLYSLNTLNRFWQV